MALAIFDLDQTLLNGDSDFLWGEFLTQVGAVDAKTHQAKNQYFFDEYKLGKLDIYEFLEFALEPLSQYPLKQLNTWHKQFMQEKILPLTLTKAQKTVDWHKQQGDEIMVITATNDFVTRPIVNHYGINTLLATQAQKTQAINANDIGYTGKLEGVPCFKEGKITNLKNHLKVNSHLSLKGSYFYSDSHNDLPLLELVDNPIVVHGDEKLCTIAIERNWQQQNWKI